MDEKIPILEVYFNGKCWSLFPGGSDSLSYFGGPHTDHVDTAVDLESAVLHHVATINLPKFGVLGTQFGFSVPLFYGLCHEGCVIEYHKTATAAIEFTSLDPAEAEEGYPYRGYPPILPYYELGVAESNEYRPEDLRHRLANTGWRIREDFLYVVVMEHPAVGHCLFEPGSGVEIVFEYVPSSGNVRATNQCS